MKYENDPRFSNYYLEDSYVLKIREEPLQIIFDLLVVLTPEHPNYEPPSNDQRHCYRHAILKFENVSEAIWTGRNKRTFTDTDGKTDVGNIDWLEIGSKSQYELEGDWGRLELSASRVSLSLL